jgi:tetratricopeptide (TPR) repeat protein
MSEVSKELDRLNEQVSRLYQEGRFEQAIPLQRRVVEVVRAELGEAHPDFAAGLNNLALLYQAMGDHAAALPLYRQALEVRRAALGEDHPDFAAGLNNLAALHQAMGEHAAALPDLARDAESRP